LLTVRGAFSDPSDKCPLCPLAIFFLDTSKPAPILALSTYYPIYLSFYKVFMYVWVSVLVDMVCVIFLLYLKCRRFPKICRYLGHLPLKPKYHKALAASNKKIPSGHGGHNRKKVDIFATPVANL
jgi:hypothetical protein